MGIKRQLCRRPAARRSGIDRRVATVAAALAIAAVATLLGAAASSAATRSLYYDIKNDLCACGFDRFGSGFTGGANSVLSARGMPNATSARSNVAIGDYTLAVDTKGSFNVAVGSGAMPANSTGNSNVATGINALQFNTSGDQNVAVGSLALFQNGTGNGNVALGSGAGNRLKKGSNNVYIANRGVDGDSGRIRIGTEGKQTAVFLAGVNGASISGPTRAVVVNGKGRLGTAPSPTAKLKHALRPLRAEVQRQRRQLRRQAKELRWLREQVRRRY